MSWGEFLLRRWGLSDAYAYADHTTGAARDGDSDNDSDFEILDIFVPRQKGASSHTSRAGSPMRGRSSKSPARHRSRSRDRGAPRQLQPSAFSQAAAANAILAHASPEHDPNQSSQQGRRHSSGVGGDGDGDDYDYDYEVPGTPESSGTDLYDSDDQEDEETVSESPPLLEPSTQAVRQAEAVVHEGPTQAEQSDEFRRSVGVLSMSRAATLAQDEAARERAARKRYIAEAKKQVFHPVELYGNKTLYTSGPATERDLLRDEDTEGAYMDLIQQSANHDWHIKQFPYALSVRASGQQVVISKLLQIDGWNCSWREELTVSIYDFMRMVGEIHTWRVPLLFGYLAAEAYVSTGRPGGRPLLRIRLSDIVPLTSHSNAHARTFQRMVVIHERALVDTDYIPLRISDTDEKLTWAHVVSQAREYDGRHDTLQRLVDDDILRQYMHRLGIARALLSRTSPFAASSSLAAAAAAGAGA